MPQTIARQKKAKPLRSVRILGSDYPIINQAVNNSALGSCWHLFSTIGVSNNQSADGQAETLIHEAIHAILWHFRLEPKESVIQALAVGLVGFLRDNPEALRRIVASEAIVPLVIAKELPFPPSVK